MQHSKKTVNELKVLKVKCESDFLFFVRYFFKARYGYKFTVNSHHHKIAKKLEAVANGEIKRLVINMPPRYGKTEMAVICFIAWCIAKNPSSKFIHLSFSDALVLDNSSEVKELIESEAFQEIWPVDLKKDSQSKKKWYTKQKGGVYATAAGGPVTGFGAGSTNEEEFAGAIIIDDPLKPDDSDSDKLRGRVNLRMNNTIKSRVNSRATPIIVIMQRLHDQDLSGFCLNGGTGDQWDHLNIPAISESGEALWPWKHTIQELRDMEQADRYGFSGQYMQEPVPESGVFFIRDRFNWYETLPKHLNFYGASDYAVTDGGGDFTEHGVFGIDPDANIYITDWWSGQTASDVWIEQQLDLIQKYRVAIWAGETGPIKSAVEPYLTRRSRERKVFTNFEWLSHAKNNKEANARTFQALVNAGKVYVPRDAEWASDLISQLVRFPKATYDDKVDVCSLFARMINDVWAAKPGQRINKGPIDRYDKEPAKTTSWKTY